LRMLEEGAALARDSGDDQLTADTLIELGTATHVASGDPGQTEALWNEALALYRRAGDRLGVDRCLHNLGEIARGRGDYQQALASYEASLPVVRELGDQVGLGTVLMNLGATTRALGDLDRATAVYGEALAIHRAIGDVRGITCILYGLAGVILDRGHAEQADRFQGAAAALAEVAGAVLDPVDTDQIERDVKAVRNQLGEAAFEVTWMAGRTLPLETALTAALESAGALEPAVDQAPSNRTTVGYGLTERELEVLRLVVAGRTDREIAEALFIGHRTAQTHVANILAKLGVNSRTAAATAAIAAGIVATPSGPAD